MALPWDETDEFLIVGAPVGDSPRRIAPGRYRVAAVADFPSDTGSFLPPGESEQVVPDCVAPLVVISDMARVHISVDFGARRGAGCDVSVVTE